MPRPRRRRPARAAGAPAPTNPPQPPVEGSERVPECARALVQRLEAIPSRFRTFEVPESVIHGQYGMEPAALDALVSYGLPYVERDSVRFFEYADLHFLGVRLGTARMHLLGIRLWAGTLRRAAAKRLSAVRISYLPHLADFDGPTEATILLPEGPRRVQLVGNRPVAAFEASLRTDWPTIPDDVLEIVEPLANLDFYPLRSLAFEPGGREVALAAELTYCGTTAALVGASCAARGYRTRSSMGLIVGLPYSSTHIWIELDVDDVWTPVDPVVRELLCEFGGLERDEWPAERCLGGMLVRLGTAESWPVTAQGRKVGVTCLTTET
jgi:hypothetical protein